MINLRHRSTRQLFPIGIVVAVLLGIVVAPRLMGTSDPLRAILYGMAIGLVASVTLFVALKFWDRRLS